LKPTSSDLVGPDADPMLEHAGHHWPHRPEAHSTGGRTARIGYVVSDALHQHAPPEGLLRVEAVDFETDMGSWGEVQFASRRSAKYDDALVEK